MNPEVTTFRLLSLVQATPRASQWRGVCVYVLRELRRNVVRTKARIHLRDKHLRFCSCTKNPVFGLRTGCSAYLVYVGCGEANIYGLMAEHDSFLAHRLCMCFGQRQIKCIQFWVSSFSTERQQFFQIHLYRLPPAKYFTIAYVSD